MPLGLVADFVQEDTATTGSVLTLTLTAKSGYARFSDAFAVGDVVYYTIRNGNDIELGRGTVQTGNTLDRTTPLKTLDAGVFDDTAPARLTLSGSSVVSCAPSAAYLDDIRQFYKVVTDTTDISLVDIASSYTAFGASFAVDIPTQGHIWFTPALRLQSDVAASTVLAAGLRIGTTNYWPRYSDNGTIAYNRVATALPSIYREGFGLGDAVHIGGVSTGLDIAKSAIPTGTQTVQLIVARTDANAATIKGTAVTSRIFVQILDAT